VKKIVTSVVDWIGSYYCICAKCNHSVAVGDHFCRNCGDSIDIVDDKIHQYFDGGFIPLTDDEARVHLTKRFKF
jgi:hypothetical protein